MKILMLIFFTYCIHVSAQDNLGCHGDKFNQRIDSLIKEGKKKNNRALEKYFSKNRNTTVVQFRWPMRAIPVYQEIPSYYTISNYVDQDSTEDVTLDYNCLQKTYDKHRGTDITIWPFMWHMMSQQYVEVIASADGLVTTVDDDNNNDTNCLGGNSNNSNNNTVIITHADGSISIYYHIKDNSIVVNDGDEVSAGDKIAMVGSSGASTGPHLHFEVYDSNSDIIDPFYGNCNGMNNESWWIDQHPYWNERVNRIMCHYAEPELVGDDSTGFCDPENIFAKNNFEQGVDIYYGVAMVDIQDGTVVEIDVYDSDGSSIFSDSYTHNDDPDNALYLIFDSNIPSGAPSGTYKVRVDIGQEEFYHYFTVNCPTSQTITNDLSGDNGFLVSTTLIISSELEEAGFPPAYENTDLRLQAGTEIKLSPGFHAPAGTYIWTRLRGCNFTH